jgi:hypothetical protein
MAVAAVTFGTFIRNCRQRQQEAYEQCNDKNFSHDIFTCY